MGRKGAAKKSGAAKGGSFYHDKTGTGGVLSDLGRHGMQDGEPLKSSFFPVIYPGFDQGEKRDRDKGIVGRNPMDIVSKLGGLAGQAAGEKFFSFFQVLGSSGNEECDVEDDTCKVSPKQNDLERVIETKTKK